MWALEHIGCKLGRTFDAEPLSLLGLGLERWRDGFGQVPVKGALQDDTPLQTVHGGRFGLPNGKAGGHERWYVRTEDVSSIEQSHLWKLYDQSILTSMNVMLEAIVPGSEYAPFVRSEQVPAKSPSESSSPRDAFQGDDASSSLWAPLRDYLHTALTGTELYLTGRTVECSLVVPLAKISLKDEADMCFEDPAKNHMLNVNVDACYHCPYYVKSVIVGRELPFTIYIHSVNPRSPKKTQGLAENLSLFTLDAPRFQIAIDGADLGEEIPDLASLDDVITYLDSWIARSVCSDVSTWTTLFVEVLATDFCRAASTRVLVDSEPLAFGPHYCPRCRNHQMIPYKRVYSDPFDHSSWNHEEGTRIPQVMSNPLEQVTQEILDDPEIILDPLPLFAAEDEERRKILFCPSFCCATVYSKTAEDDDAGASLTTDEGGPDSPGSVDRDSSEGSMLDDRANLLHCMTDAEYDDPMDICAAIDMKLHTVADVLTLRKDALCEEIANACGVCKKSIVFQSPQLNEHWKKLEHDESSEEWFTTNADDEESEASSDALSGEYDSTLECRLGILSKVAMKALYGHLEDMGDNFATMESPKAALTRLTKLVKFLMLESGILSTATFSDRPETVRMAPGTLPLVDLLRCLGDCPLGCGEQLPKLNKSKYHMHIDWKCPVTISSRQK
eukprot:GEMP01010124.1.p1 GENE.GEMP01010124.1~~GEMP01010124.1.p1  ORF type:complete len:711 (+),score=145.82 GEMP01010124.1:118-2133(+)